jgi:hypothetical protein
MAQQLGPLFFECTWDDLTLYKMVGKYYLRKKSRLTREKVLMHKAFRLTRVYANLLAAASKVASSIYNDLPIEWRQFWMFRSFTGEAMKMLEDGQSPQEAYDYLWKTYLEYWFIYQQTTGIKLKTGRTAKNFRRGKTYKTRLKHRTENPKCRRYRMLLSKHHWKSSYDHTADILERERKRIAREKKFKWLEEYRASKRKQEEEERRNSKKAAIRLAKVPLLGESFDKEALAAVIEVRDILNTLTAA